MAEVFDPVNGEQLERLIARHYEVQAELGALAVMHAELAAETLAAHEHDGHSQIVVERGDIDRYVILDDTDGLLAAKAILSGRGGTRQPVPVFDSMLQPRHKGGKAVRRRQPGRKVRRARG